MSEYTGNGQKPTTLTTAPFPASRKVYVAGTHPGWQLMREISLSPTTSMNGHAPTPNQPVTVYDTSGPYTDPSVTIDVRADLRRSAAPGSQAGRMLKSWPRSPRTTAACALPTPSWTACGSNISVSRSAPRPDGTSPRFTTHATAS